MRKIIYPIVMLTLAAGFSAALAADDAGALQERLKARYEQVYKLKKAGKIGETFEGYVEAVKPEFKDETRPLVDAENSDRRELYKLLAKDEGISPEEVARNNAVRNFQKAKKGEYLKGPDGNWKQK